MLGKFWSESASKTGRHHHGETQWQHAREVYLLARLHWRRVPWEEIRHNKMTRRSFLRAALFHDFGKQLNRESHEIAGFRWMWPRDRLAAFLILRHMGRWGVLFEDQVAELSAVDGLYLLTTQNLYLADLLAGCDYTSAYLGRIRSWDRERQGCESISPRAPGTA